MIEHWNHGYSIPKIIAINFVHWFLNIIELNKYYSRLKLVAFPKGLIKVLQNSGFTIEKILDSKPSDIAEKLGIDAYVGEIIHKETSKAISKINPDLLLFN